MYTIILLSCLAIAAATPEYVTKKLCKNVDTTQCTVHSVIVDPCAQGPAFCVVKKDKNYAITLDMVPHFSASKLKLSISADVDNNGYYETIIKTPDNACGLLYCPLRAEERRIFDLNMSLDKRASMTNEFTDILVSSSNPRHRLRVINPNQSYFKMVEGRKGKFPVKVKLWDELDESKACCVSFNVKVK